MKPILVVDDEPEQLRSMRVGLATKGFAVIEAFSAEEAVRYVSIDPDRIGLVITDYAMPEINGLMLLEKIKEIDGHIPVVMMTAYGDKQLAIDALRYGCNGFIEKPFTMEQVSAEIRRIENKKQFSAEKVFQADLFPAHVHQLNNLLAAIEGYAELGLFDLDDRDSVRLHLEAIMEVAKKTHEINRKTLHFKKGHVIKKEVFDLRRLLEQCLNNYEIVIKQFEVILEKKYSGLFGSILGDPFCLEQVFSNLIQNAIQAMEEASVKVLTISATPAENPGFVAVSIKDTGCGIREEFLTDIFKPYMTLRKKGTGLGLYVVRTIVKGHGGMVRVESVEGKGTTFTVNLPLAEIKRPDNRSTE